MQAGGGPPVAARRLAIDFDVTCPPARERSAFLGRPGASFVPLMADDPITIARSASRAAFWRAHLVRRGLLIPLDGRPTLRLDDRGRHVAKRHAAAGDYGRTVIATPPGYFELPAWHVRALEARDRRVARFNAFLKRTWPMRSWSEVAAGVAP